MKFRELCADEIECRISTVSEKGISLLLYKNARCDMKILDECVGPMNWQRDHKDIKGNMYSGIGIWDETKGQWIWKWDCGTESYTEKEKGEASDSFKRAGFNWGIGRELYTAPFIWIPAEKLKTLKFDENKRKWTCNDFFVCECIEYMDGRISYLKLINSKNKFEYTYGFSSTLQSENQNDAIGEAQFSEIRKLIKAANVNERALCDQYGIESLMLLTMVQYTALKQKLEKVLANGEYGDNQKR